MMGFGRDRTRIVLQMEAAECGAACLTMVLSAHGKEITLEEARARCGTSRDGVDAASIMRAATSYNMDVKAIRIDPATLKDIPLPAILHWNFDHFVTLEAVKGDRITIIDPASGRRLVQADELDRSMTGLVLAMVPGEGFKKSGQRPKLVSSLLEQASGSIDGLAIVFLIGVLGVIPGLVLAGTVETFADYVIGQQRANWLFFTLLALACTIITQAILRGLQEWVVSSLRSKIGVSIAAKAFEHALFLPLSFFAQRNPGEVTSRLKIGSEIGGLVAGPLAQILPNILVVTAYLSVVAFYDLVLGSLIAAISLLNLLVLIRLSRHLADANRYHDVLEGRVNGIAIAGFMAFDSFRKMGREDLLASKWLAAEEASLDAEQRLGILRTIAGLGPAVATMVISICVLSVGSLRVIDGQLDLNNLLALQVLASLVAGPVAALASDYCSLQEAAGSLLRMQDLVRHPCDGIVNRHNGEARSPDGSLGEPNARSETAILKLENVSFGFGSNQDLFSNVSLQLHPGVMTAVVGSSGTGKSTFARICAGIISPRQGNVLFKGQTLRAWPHETLRRNLLYVPQQVAIFTASVRDNIRMWDEDIEDDQIMDALERVQLSDVVHGVGGLDRMLSSQYPCFSGGESQRLALARALVRRPSLLILDEVTSALDTLSEKQILSTLRDQKTTILIVTHRLGTIRHCDQQLTLDGLGLTVMSRRLSMQDDANAQALPAYSDMRDAV
ncbi:cysteine peptidase family C39 domain-containing protein [Cohaesibacter haloalkalitolerans]|uniref:cysteine peptidase family C39 domain-containing protein n=1 Tax=Cohaesibacter haloalkalitolerans TaxID=1162980 RepID=UPI000E652FC9|nr:cysteine peptidase family C39 domain-containing protein [Cohaesibacter haloalkalitolerans]